MIIIKINAIVLIHKRGANMITSKKETAVFVSFFAVCISILMINIIINFNYLDFIYLLFIIGCLFRYIYIKITD